MLRRSALNPVDKTKGIFKPSAEELAFDLVIVGGGPAGALAAILAAEAGLAVALLERKSKPKPKPCGGFISKRAIDLLPENLNLPDDIKTNIHKITVVRGSRDYSYCSEQPLGWLTRRDLFDSFMLSQAENRGAVVINGVYPKEITHIGNEGNHNRYQVSTGGEKCIRLTARYLIGADGAYGSTAKLAGLYKKRVFLYGRTLSAVYAGAQPEQKAGTLLFYPSPLALGMSWAFYADHWVNLGIGGLAGRKSLKRILNQVYQGKNNKLATRFWPLPFLGPLRANSRGNLMLIGDAAGLVEPFSGEGLFNAFASAHIAFQTVITATRKNEEAEKVFRNLFRNHFHLGFAATMLGAALLQARSILHPSSLPSQIALLMQNRLWFCRQLKDPVFNKIVD
jgi:geranylgeranyl reductase family protein